LSFVSATASTLQLGDSKTSSSLAPDSTISCHAGQASSPCVFLPYVEHTTSSAESPKSPSVHRAPSTLSLSLPNAMCFAGLQAFLKSLPTLEEESRVRMVAFFDHEEVGSRFRVKIWAVSVS
jgi:hypothetical protein